MAKVLVVVVIPPPHSFPHGEGMSVVIAGCLLDGLNLAVPIHRPAGGCIRLDGRAIGNEGLLGSGLRHDLGFLVGHFWLLSRAFAPWGCVKSRIRHPPGGKGVFNRYSPFRQDLQASFRTAS